MSLGRGPYRLGESGPKAKEWAEAQIEELLLLGDAEGLIKAIACLPSVAPPDGQSKSLSERSIEYFQNNAKIMHCPEDRARGPDIGSGIAESSGRRVVGVRCKQPGMRWCEEGLTAIVDLCARVLSNRYDSTIAGMTIAA